MDKIFVVPDRLQFSPAIVDGAFWSHLSALLLYLGDPTLLMDLYESDRKAYYDLIAPYQQFIIATEGELKQKGLLEEKEIGAQE